MSKDVETERDDGESNVINFNDIIDKMGSSSFRLPPPPLSAATSTQENQTNVSVLSSNEVSKVGNDVLFYNLFPLISRS